MVRVFLSLWLGCLAAGAVAASDDDSQPADTTMVNGGVYKGRKEVVAVLGVGSSHDLWGGVDHVSIFSLGGRFGYVLNDPKGPGFLKGNLEVAGELLPLFRVSLTDAATYGVAMTVLGRHYFMPSSSWRPYVVLGFGLLSTKDGVPARASPINLTPQAGFGVTYSHRNRFSFYVEYRLHHTSAGKYEGGINPGINSSFLQFSASVIQW